MSDMSENDITEKRALARQALGIGKEEFYCSIETVVSFGEDHEYLVKIHEDGAFCFPGLDEKELESGELAEFIEDLQRIQALALSFSEQVGKFKAELLKLHPQ